MADLTKHLVDSREFAQNKAQVEQGFWRKFKKVAGKIPFSEDLLAAYYCASDPASPFQVKVILLTALAYFVIPTDLVPDIVAGLGFTDDAAVLMIALRTVAGHVTDTHKQRARAVLADGEDSPTA
jgi:uncharacterized membrane protein YkvA (DUF1232 family)